MKGTLDCIPCLVRQAVTVSKMVFDNDEDRQKWIGESLSDLAQRDFLNTTPPAISRDFFRDLLKKGHLNDPYKDIKTFYNDEILKMESSLSEKINQAPHPLKEALILSIAGNIIDFGTPGGVSRERVDETLKDAEEKGLTRDDSTSLFEELKESKNLLYLGDNCGEIVFDKLFIKEILKSFPDISITFAVRGGAILNDVLKEDASQTGIDKIVRVISNGDNAPGTILNYCSEEFLEVFHRADLIISKGQGNLETLDEVAGKKIYFLFMAKCDLISRNQGVELNSLMCLKNQR